MHDIHVTNYPINEYVCERAEGNSTFLFHPTHLPE